MSSKDLTGLFNEKINTGRLPTAEDMLKMCEKESEFRHYTQLVKTLHNSSEFVGWAERDGNCTYHFQKLERYFSALDALCSELTAKVGRKVHVHALFTPPNSQGFAIHYDFEDVFVVQKSGAKFWKTWRPMRTEISPELLKLDQARQNLKKWSEISPAEQFVLSAGETRLIPLGTPHVAWTEALESFHYSFKISPKS